MQFGPLTINGHFEGIAGFDIAGVEEQETDIAGAGIGIEVKG